MLEDPYSAQAYIAQIETEKFVLDAEKRYPRFITISFTLRMYQAEALFQQQKYKESKQVLQNLTFSTDLPIQTEHVNMLNMTETYSKKVVVQQNLISLELIAGNIESAKTGLEAMTTGLGITYTNGKEMPLCLLLSWIYYYIRAGDKKMAVELIKRRRYLSQMFNVKGSLLKIAH